MLYLALTASILTAVETCSPSDRTMMEHLMCDGKLVLNPELDPCPQRHIDFASICQWHSVKCEASRVVGITLNREIGEYLRVFDFQWIPRDVRNLIVKHQASTGVFLARMLPRHLFIVKIIACGLEGSPSLTDLPQEISLLDLSGNKFVGTINALFLPKGMVMLDLQGNPLQAVYFSEKRPLRTIQLQGAGHAKRQRKIRLIRVCTHRI